MQKSEKNPKNPKKAKNGKKGGFRAKSSAFSDFSKMAKNGTPKNRARAFSRDFFLKKVQKTQKNEKSRKNHPDVSFLPPFSGYFHGNFANFEEGQKVPFLGTKKRLSTAPLFRPRLFGRGRGISPVENFHFFNFSLFRGVGGRDLGEIPTLRWGVQKRGQF